MGARGVVRIGAGVAFAGLLTSGPLGLIVVSATHPQPPWRDAETFVLAYHPVQVLPYFFGFLLVGGMVAVIAALHEYSDASHRIRSTAAVACAGTFAAMIVTNYAIQTAVVPAMVGRWDPSSAPVLALLTMANSRSFGWALEMWGYGALGVATWLMAPVVRRAAIGSAGRVASVLFMVNGPTSLAAALAFAVMPGWVLAPSGLAAFVIWNVMVLTMTLLLAVGARSMSQ